MYIFFVFFLSFANPRGVYEPRKSYSHTSLSSQKREKPHFFLFVIRSNARALPCDCEKVLYKTVRYMNVASNSMRIKYGDALIYFWKPLFPRLPLFPVENIRGSYYRNEMS